MIFKFRASPYYSTDAGSLRNDRACKIATHDDRDVARRRRTRCRQAGRRPAGFRNAAGSADRTLAPANVIVECSSISLF